MRLEEVLGGRADPTAVVGADEVEPPRSWVAMSTTGTRCAISPSSLRARLKQSVILAARNLLTKSTYCL